MPTRENNRVMWNNRIRENIYFRNLYTTAIGTLKIEGLPENIEKTWLLKHLLFDSKLVWFKDDALDQVLVSDFNFYGTFNFYDVPTTLRTNTHANGVTYSFKTEDVVWHYTHASRVPLVNYIAYYADLLGVIDGIKRLNMLHQKTPYSIVAKEETEQEIKRLFNDLENLANVVVISNNDILDDLKVMNLAAPWVADKLEEMKNCTMNDFYTILGINNEGSFVRKVEQVQSAELEQNDQAILANRNAWLGYLQESIEKVNEKFGTNISIDFVSENIASKEENENAGI